MNGVHIMVDCYQVSQGGPLMTSTELLLAQCRRAVDLAGLTAVAESAYHFGAGTDAASQSGITAVILLAESHVTVHTWPERQQVTLDAYVCNFLGDNSGKAQLLISALIDLFKPENIDRQEIQRGRLSTGRSGL